MKAKLYCAWTLGFALSWSAFPNPYVNQVGGQDELVFDGRSFVLDAQGQLVLRARAFDAEKRIKELETEVKVFLDELDAKVSKLSTKYQLIKAA